MPSGADELDYIERLVRERRQLALAVRRAKTYVPLRDWALGFQDEDELAKRVLGEKGRAE